RSALRHRGSTLGRVHCRPDSGPRGPARDDLPDGHPERRVTRGGVRRCRASPVPCALDRDYVLAPRGVGRSLGRSSSPPEPAACDDGPPDRRSPVPPRSHADRSNPLAWGWAFQAVVSTAGPWPGAADTAPDSPGSRWRGMKKALAMRVGITALPMTAAT